MKGEAKICLLIFSADRKDEQSLKKWKAIPLEDLLEVLLVEFELGRASLIIFIAEYFKFFGQDWCTTVENTYSSICMFGTYLGQHLFPVWFCKMGTNLRAGNNIDPILGMVECCNHSDKG